MKKLLLAASSATLLAFFFTFTVAFVHLGSFTASAQTPTNPTPTFYCAGNCPGLTPSPTALPIGMTDVPTAADVAPTTVETMPTETEVEPCESTVSIQRHHRKKWKHKHRRGMGNMSIEKILEMINKMLERLGLPPMQLPTTPTQPDDSTEPSPTLLPSNPTPTTEPCLEPTEVDEEPTTAPADPTTAAPTTGSENPTTVPTTGSITGGRTDSVKITFYGAWDNDPPGSKAIAYPVIHDEAGGTGTYEDPLTFASPAGDGAYPIGQIIYVPMVQKYFIKEDQCAVSWTAPDGCGAVTMVDLYVGNPSGSEAVVECENSITPSGNTEIIVDPPNNLTVSSELLWDESTGKCASF